MSWSILSDETKKQKLAKKRKRKIKRGSKRGRYVVLGSRGRKGRKSPIHCTICGRTLATNLDGLVCRSCGEGTEKKVAEKRLSIPQLQHTTQMAIPKMTGK
jgi:ribosomal protein L37E